MQWDNYYRQTYCRLPPYIIGILLGCLLHRTKDRENIQLKKVINPLFSRFNIYTSNENLVKLNINLFLACGSCWLDDFHLDGCFYCLRFKPLVWRRCAFRWNAPGFWLDYAHLLRSLSSFSIRFVRRLDYFRLHSPTWRWQMTTFLK